MIPLIYSILIFAVIATIGIGLFIYKQWTDDLQNPVRNLILTEYGYKKVTYPWISPAKAFKLSRLIPNVWEYLVISHENRPELYVFYCGQLYDIAGLTYDTIWDSMFYRFDSLESYGTQLQNINISGLARSWRMKMVLKHFEYVRSWAKSNNTFRLSDFNFGEKQVINKFNLEGQSREAALHTLLRNLPYCKTRTKVLRVIIELKEAKKEMAKVATSLIKEVWTIC